MPAALTEDGVAASPLTEDGRTDLETGRGEAELRDGRRRTGLRLRRDWVDGRTDLETGRVGEGEERLRRDGEKI